MYRYEKKKTKKPTRSSYDDFSLIICRRIMFRFLNVKALNFRGWRVLRKFLAFYFPWRRSVLKVCDLTNVRKFIIIIIIIIITVLVII